MELCARGAALKVGIEEESQLRARAEQVQRWGGCTLRGTPNVNVLTPELQGLVLFPLWQLHGELLLLRTGILSHYSGILCVETSVYKPAQLPHYTDRTPMT